MLTGQKGTTMADSSKHIIVINASPRQNGNTEALVDSFIQGSEEAGNTVTKFNLRQLQISPCMGCMGCKTGHGNPCILHDGMDLIYESWSNADALVIASPVYWQHFTALFALFRDRLSAITSLDSTVKDAALILSAASPDDAIFDMPQKYYDYMVNTLGLKDCGRVAASGVSAPGDVITTKFIQQAYDLGKSI